MITRGCTSRSTSSVAQDRRASWIVILRTPDPVSYTHLDVYKRQGLHRVEASVQPGNVRSAGLLRSLGLRRRGAWPAYLWLPEADGTHAWRDHVIYLSLIHI